ncbi:hypothetical protein MZO42_00005 [Sphingomonas psychrotolerans]|uniref:Uncharacterized protein n=1 Tax=Sphingomonas psychrotolerans TaxID=1327635 RepID=A0ABU3MZX9_9SPHN|nr:hypothetical protein [Sphingomonas psychrotolerans]MDT8757067.1 hypothetical protein [Sphingomonas psychrotolerans]
MPGLFTVPETKMKLLQLPRCLFGLHQRDRGHAWHDGAVVRSHCTGCGKRMLKDGSGWHLEAAASSPHVTND